MKKSEMRKYARLIAEVGAHVQKGQEVRVRAMTEIDDFAVMVAEECYKLGAKSVSIEWQNQEAAKLAYKRESLKTLSTVQEWKKVRYEYWKDNLPVIIHLVSDDPDAFKGVNQEKVAKANAAVTTVFKPYRLAMDNKYQWVIAGVPGKKWAKKVFPNERASVAVEKLWNAILYTSRVTDNPVQAWNEHNADLLKRSEYLNSLGLRQLKYRSKKGTDLTVGLIEDGIFMGGGETTLGGVYYNPNIPTEEVFTSPEAGVADGIVYASKPLSYQGEIIDNFSVTFKGGKVVEVHAEKNEELLKKLVAMDENSCRLGECALVPFDSPINNSGILFYNTLYDENCCCHLALGRGFTNCIKDFEKYSTDECHAKGINDSIIHVDFMIGTADLDIDGVTADGKTVAIFRNGNWAF